MYSPYSQKLLKQVQRHLKHGGIIAYPTEFCYGLGCNPFDYKAIKNLLYLKRRAKSKGLIVIAGKYSQLDQVIAPLAPKQVSKLKKYWPGFYSLILPINPHLPKNLTGTHKKIAVRITKHQGVKQLCAFLNMPLVSTSANRTTYKPIKTYKECMRQFGDRVMVLPGTTDFAKTPSTIIDWESKKILR